MNNLRHNLNQSQKMAATHVDGPALVLAGAGSGKTRVLTERICHLIKSGKANSFEILALTFTNKAAEEMKSRIKKLLGNKYDFPWVGTFHSISYKILSIFITEIGKDYKKNFTIYDPNDQLKIIKNVVKELDLDSNEYNPNLIRGKLDKLKNLYTFDEWDDEWSYRDEKERSVFHKYQKALEDNNAMDFGDLILNFYELISRNDKVKKNLHNRFKYILVDEYQDTNKIQFRLLNNLASKTKNIFAVGDEDQTIYGWRGASIDNIFKFKEIYHKTKIYKLEQNYRSSPEILQVSNQLIFNNKKRMDKVLTTSNPNAGNVEVISCPDNSVEADFVSEKITQYIKEKKYRLKDFGIFYRTNAQSRSLEDVFRRRKIKYKIFGNISFYDRAEIKDLISFLRLIVNPYDEISFNRIVNIPPRGIGAKTLIKMKSIQESSGMNFLECIEYCSDKNDVFSKKVASNLKDFKDSYRNLTLEINNKHLPISEAIEKFLINIKYFEYLEDTDKKENISEFLNLVAEYQNDNKESSLNDFLNMLSISSSIDNFNEDSGYVAMMTVHLAKGLEFPCVFLVGMEEGLFPHSKILDDPDENGIEEERRLCYVAFTRAMNKLHISYCRMRRQFGDINYCEKSQFIAEVENCKNVELDNYGQDEVDNKNHVKVFHHRFGEGVILEEELDEFIDDVVTVLFDNGTKKRVFLSDLEDG
ncbi:MAG: UvrD-helicase domain-containing protein [Thermodesulfobacteriota bacterium]|nr:UvrD-helicase domain-containing protein [Thermodesulfobacteriota bacterium]